MLPMSVAEYYAGKSIFITGATGFMGKVLVEKLLRSCPDIKTIYILIRKKRGQSSEERLNELSECRVYEKLLEQQPKAFMKVHLITGDILEEGLGISISDIEELRRECQIVFNNAACVSFNTPLRGAVRLNTIGTKNMLQLAETMKKLEVFVHVSTSYCHDEREVVEEKLYPSKHNPHDIIRLTEWMDDATLAAIQSELIKPYPNTYGYSKCLAETVVSEYNGRFPIAIARPTIVLPSYKEPMPGWVDNINGPTGFIYAAARGVLHTMCWLNDRLVDTMPVDLTINGLILLAYTTALEQPKEIRVCNVTQSEANTITWIEGAEKWSSYLKDYPLSFSLWYPVATGKRNKYQHKIAEFFTQILPAYFIDVVLLLLGRERFMVKVLKRLTHGLEMIEYYSDEKIWNFENAYFRSLQHQVTEEDRKTFYTDVWEVDVDEYMKNYVKGIREYYCKEDPSTLPKAKRLHQRLYYLHITMKYLLCTIIFYYLYRFLKMLLISSNPQNIIFYK